MSLLLGFLMVSHALVPPAAGAQLQPVNSDRLSTPGLADRMIAGWFKQLDVVHQEVLDGEWKKAVRQLDQVEADLIEKLVEGPDAPRLLGQVSLLRALVEAGRGERATASWHYAVACSFLPALATLDLSRYGVAGEILAAERVGWEAPLESGEGSAQDHPPGEVTPPRTLESASPVTPRSHRVLCSGGSVALNVIIDTSGNPTRPTVTSDVHPLLAFVALRSLNLWRFAPAEFNGRPVPFSWDTTVEFQTKHCSPG
jgi:hypothetical protein